MLQRFILYLGHTAYAVTAVLFTLLLFSGMGSRWSDRISLHLALGGLAVLVLVMPVLLDGVFAWTLGWPLATRLAVTVLALAPLGVLMGVPFPAGIRLLAQPQGTGRTDIPWIWAVTGAASVIAPILAALLALTLGLSDVLRLGAFCYAGALVTAWVSVRPGAVLYPDQ